MKKLSRIATAEPVIDGVLKLVFTEGYEGVVDLWLIIAQAASSNGFRSRKTCITHPSAAV
jgi:hypothetical protein